MVAMTQIAEKVPSFNFSDNANHAELEKLQNNSHSIHDDAAFDIEMAPNRGLMRANQKNFHLLSNCHRPQKELLTVLHIMLSPGAQKAAFYSLVFA